MAEAHSISNAIYHRGVNRLAKATTFFAFLVIFLGAATKSKEAGLTIPWPFFYEIHWDWFGIENLNAEYTHRTLVAILSGLTVALVLAIFLKDGRPAVRKLAIGSFLTLIAQAVLGALTVHFLAKAKTSVPHALLGQTFLCLAASIAVVTSKSWIEAPAPAPSQESPSLKKLAIWTIIAVTIQILLGGAIRHDDQAAAMRDGHFAIFAWHLAAHFVGMLAVVYFVCRILMRVFRQHRSQREVMFPARMIMMLLGVQILLGFGAAILKVATLDAANSPPPLRVWTATLHTVTGALILAFSVVLALRAHRHILALPSSEQPSAQIVGATA